MGKLILNQNQVALLDNSINERIFLEGPPGSGKTTTAHFYIQKLLNLHEPGSSIFLLTPQRTLATPYISLLGNERAINGSIITITTAGGLARRMVELFWPLIAEEAGFSQPNHQPIFLTLETTQYHMAGVIKPLLDQGFFSSVVINRNRLYSQIIDNLNKAAVIGFPIEDIGKRLISAWVGDPGQINIYKDTQTCVGLFREHCLQHNLLDFSLQVEIFRRFLLDSPMCQDYLLRTYRHIIADNIEEETPFAHALLGKLISTSKSSLLIFDRGGGYRRFLGADPESAALLEAACDKTINFEGSYIMSKGISEFFFQLEDRLRNLQIINTSHKISESKNQRSNKSIIFVPNRYFPDMLNWVGDQINILISYENVSPGEIAILSPFLSDGLKFSIANRLKALGVPWRSHRPSRSLREEPITRCLITYALIAHPDWLNPFPELLPNKIDITFTLMLSIAGMDLIRAQLLTDHLVHKDTSGMEFLNFDQLQPDVQDRVTHIYGKKYDQILNWIKEYQKRPSEHPDIFFRRIFGELLAQPGFGFHANFSAGEICSNLIESSQKFRRAATQISLPLGLEFIQMLREGVLASQYVRSWNIRSDNSVLVAPAYTFLVANQPVDIQFWLDPGNRNWVDRIYQPLTHPYVLSKEWIPGQKWTDELEFQSSEKSLIRLVTGLLQRCRKKIYLGISNISEQGFEQTGPLLKAINNVIRNPQMKQRL